MASKGFLFICLAVAGVWAAPPANNGEQDDVSMFLETTNRIVGGELAPEGSVPWKVALSSGLLIRSFFCGGSIISQRHVLTAAHCIDAVFSSWTGLASSVRGRYGTQRWNSGGVLVSFSGNVTHPNYVSATIKNDIGVLITLEDILLSDTAKILPLNYDYVTPGTQVTVSGYGRNRQSGGFIQSQLRQVTLTIISEEECHLLRDWMASNGNYANVPPIEYHIEICTFEDIGTGTCNGDSGSAMVRNDNLEGVGVVSWGFPCAIGGPDVFARASAYKEFLEDALLQL